MKTFSLPDLGEGLADAEIVQWFVKEGDLIEAGQPMLAVETAKAVVDIPSPVSARITRLYGKAGDIMAVGSLLVEYADTAEKPAPIRESTSPDNKDSGTVVGVVNGAAAEVAEETLLIGRHRSPEQRMTGARVGASARQMPRDRLKQQSAATEKTPQLDDWETLHGLRRQMATAMTQAQQSVTLVTLFDEANIRRWSKDTRPLERLIRALIHACHVEPALNASFRAEPASRQLHEHVHIGIAVDTPEGLLVPVLHNADRYDSKSLTREVKRLREGATTRTLTTEELQGGTITLSSFGMLGGRFATPVVVPPQVAILGAGRIHLVPVMHKDKLRNDPHLPLSLSFDHRAVTGGEAARFLQALIHDLEKKH